MKFEDIYREYSPKVYRLCLGYINDADAAQDLVQDIFISVWQNLERFRQESSVSTWIFRIATNTCLRQLEKDKKKPKAELPYQLASAEENHERKEQLEILHKIIAELPETDRLIILLELEGLPQAEIASVVGLTDGNVRVRIHRIKEKLTAKFAKTHELQ